MNIPVEEKSVTGPFPEKYQCEIYKAQVTDMIDDIYNAKIKKSECVEQFES